MSLGNSVRALPLTDSLMALQMLRALEFLVAEFAWGHEQAGTTPSH